MYWSWVSSNSKATHGFDNDVKDMHAIFYGAGPVFKSKHVQPTFDNVNLYSLFAEILKLDPAQTDGSITNVNQMLKE